MSYETGTIINIPAGFKRISNIDIKSDCKVKILYMSPKSSGTEEVKVMSGHVKYSDGYAQCRQFYISKKQILKLLRMEGGLYEIY